MWHTYSFRDLFTTNLDTACTSYKYRMPENIRKHLTRTFVDDLTTALMTKPSELLDTSIIYGDLPPTKEATEYLRISGDYYLTVAGFIPEALCDRYSEFEYYLYVGKYSYFRLAQRLPREALYNSLSLDYMKIVYIINETFDLIRTRDGIDIIKTLEAYNKTRHAIFRKRLTRAGLNLAQITC